MVLQPGQMVYYLHWKIITRGSFWLEYEPHLQVNNDLASISAA